MSYQLNKVHLLISIIAALALTVGFLVHWLADIYYSNLAMLIWVSAAIVLFYCIGHFVRSFLISQVFPLTTQELENDGETTELMEAPLPGSDPLDDVMYDDSMLSDSLFDEPMSEPVTLNDL